MGLHQIGVESDHHIFTLIARIFALIIITKICLQFTKKGIYLNVSYTIIYHHHHLVQESSAGLKNGHWNQQKLKTFQSLN